MFAPKLCKCIFENRACLRIYSRFFKKIPDPVDVKSVCVCESTNNDFLFIRTPKIKMNIYGIGAGRSTKALLAILNNG